MESTLTIQSAPVALALRELAQSHQSIVPQHAIVLEPRGQERNTRVSSHLRDYVIPLTSIYRGQVPYRLSESVKIRLWSFLVNPDDPGPVAIDLGVHTVYGELLEYPEAMPHPAARLDLESPVQQPSDAPRIVEPDIIISLNQMEHDCTGRDNSVSRVWHDPP